MTVTIYLEERITDILNCYGSLNDVVNRILEAGARGEFEVMDKPTCPPKKNGAHYAVDITEPTYLGLYEIYGSKSSRISLRRLLYWFVDNEIYNDLGWEGSDYFKDSSDDRAVQLIGDIKLLLYRLEHSCSGCHEEVAIIRENLNEMERKIWDV